ncbi:phosphoheptose isomerase [Vogesella sp. LIG4]|uniref:phosphoheptose isomerase n=1 Tax=Vogesella sp. LIG4 TaxID=1192162 RepID=UPI00081F978E|nr:phosphoheptose isomerase [Vogesella sp. LIG4]SCK14119.1 D-sedoheptulose 7-phosphate isomerase [Vogesella sp. LIG4]
MDLIDRAGGHFRESIATLQLVMDELAPAIAVAAERMVASLMNEGKILACGNGGAAADAHHFVTMMLGHFEKERPGLAAIALSSDSPSLTAVGNDYEFDLIFSKQVRALGHHNDLLLVISSTGNSANIIEAIYAAHERGMNVIALTGNDGGQVAEILSPEDLHLNVPVTRAARVQEVHLLLLHALCDAIDYMLLGGE